MFIIFPCIGVAGDILPGAVDPALHLPLVLGAATSLGPCGCAQVSVSPKAGCWPCTGVQRDGWLAELEHQQGEEGTKQTLLEILLRARRFWDFFFAAE